VTISVDGLRAAGLEDRFDAVEDAVGDPDATAGRDDGDAGERTDPPGVEPDGGAAETTEVVTIVPE